MDTPKPAVFIKDPFSKWLPRPDDLEQYGISADGTPTHHWVAIHIDGDSSSALPHIGDECTMFFDISTTERTPPPAHLSASDVLDTTKKIVETFRDAEQKYNNVLARVDNDIVAATAAEDSDRVEYLEQYREAWAMRSFYKTAAEILFELITVPSEEAVREHPNLSLSVQRVVTAKAVAAVLRQRLDAEKSNDDELDYEWFGRIRTWVMDNATFPLPPPLHHFGLEWAAKRIPLPPGTLSNIALFSVSTPGQVKWASGKNRPPVRFQMKPIAPVGQLHTFMNSLFTSTKGTWSSRHPSATTVARIQHKPEAASTSAEYAAGSILKSQSMRTPPPWAARFWEHTMLFHTPVKYRNLVDGFLGLRQALDNGVFSGEALGLVNSLMKVPFGYAFVAGGPCTGKTTLAMRIVKAIISGAVDQRAFVVPDERPDGTTQNKSNPIVSETSTDAQFSEESDSDTESTTTAWYRPVWSHLSSQSTSAEEAKPEINLTPRVAWTVHSNKLADEATRRAHQACPGKIVVRVLP
ncbi:hypothetical protein NM208_g11808 [Fusarium decemcellulare]|uniref:Uncharacterized protein n=1 Tax=Fusarium decemcellulare TaxID=57161 RepID=A0ACC1RT26_9HYPO|nr:hypothetical protein NM208_g11808 [Fusarium decemcellulare]